VRAVGAGIMGHSPHRVSGQPGSRCSRAAGAAVSFCHRRHHPAAALRWRPADAVRPCGRASCGGSCLRLRVPGSRRTRIWVLSVGLDVRISPSSV